ncbi:MAG: hypothetical protein GY757_47430, partial [bacterium]|nr:hypothetical protein [bacterium]
SIFLNLSGLFFLLGAFLALFYGLESFQDREFLKLLDSIGSRKKLFWSVLASRLLLVLGYLLVIMVTTWLLYLINGVSVSIGHLLIYGLVVFWMAAFFLFAGMLAGVLENKRAGLVAVFVVWLLFVFALPAIVGKIVYSRAETITSAYDIDIETFKIFMSIEKKAKEQAGQMERDNTKTEIRQKLFEYFWDNEFKQIFNHEQGMIDEMKNVVSLHHNLSLIFPTSFFLSLNNEMSGRGYESLISFYKYVLKHKKGFIHFYANKSFYEGAKEVEPYLKGDENVFHAPETLPDNFGFGLFISLSWLLLLLFLNWLGFNRLLDRLPDIEETEAETKDFTQNEFKKNRITSEAETEDLKQDEFKKNKITSVVTFNPVLLTHFLELLRKHENRYIFVPGLDCLPGDVRVKNLFSFFGAPVPERLQAMAGRYVSGLPKDYKALAVLEIIRRFEDTEFFIFNDFLIGLSEEFMKYFADVLDILKKKKGRKIVYFTNFMPKFGDNIIKRPYEQPPF